MNAIPYGRQNITDEDIDAVCKVLKSDYLTQGPTIKQFEEAFAEYVGSKYAIAVSNGTAALHLSVLAKGLKKGDKVITTPITFAASANCIEYCGADAVFADIDPSSYLIDLTSVKNILEQDHTKSIKGIIPVDFAGEAIDMESLSALAKKYDIWIVEDACHAPGAYVMDSNNVNQYCGNGKFADATVFSFHPVKHIATGEGGMITTNDELLFEKLIQLRTHGITKNESEFENSIELAGGNSETKKFPSWYMEMQELGYNYRITDIQSALGISQLKRADKGIERRREIAAIYDNAFCNKPFILNQAVKSEGHAYHLYIIEVSDRLGLYNYLRLNKVYAQIHYFPCHLMPYYSNKGWKKGDFPNAESYYENCISLPMFPTLRSEEQELVINLILDYYNE